MKFYLIFFLAFALIACTSSVDIKNSRGLMIEYSNDGYSILLNDSLIKIKQVILDESKILDITKDRWTKIVKIKRKKGDLQTFPIAWFIKSSDRNKLLIIDHLPVKSEELDLMKMEMSAFKSVQVLKDTNFFHRKFKEVTLVTTNNNR